MRCTTLIAAALILTACSKSATAPTVTGLDPTVSFKNASSYDVGMDWYSQSGLSLHTKILRGDSTCIIFLSASAVDSVRFVIDDSTYRPAGSGNAMIWSPWFNPTTGIVLSGVPQADYPFGAEYWVFVWGGHIGPAYGADSSKYSAIVATPPCK